MSDDPTADDPSARTLRRRIVEQFSGAGERAAFWRGLERFMPAGEYLNLGYSPRYHPTLLGDSQARLAGRLGTGLARRLGAPDGRPLLDVGCGRGGPAGQFAARGFDVTGVDLVPYNVAIARRNAPAATGAGRRPAFVVADATAPPFRGASFAAVAAIDALVYIPELGAALAEAARVLEPGGWLASADLLAAPNARLGADETLSAFADAWDVAPLVAADDYRDVVREAGFAVDAVEDVTANSIGRFRRWSRAFLGLADGPAGGVLRRLLRRWDVEPAPVIDQVRAAHRALPSLRHVVVYARLDR